MPHFKQNDFLGFSPVGKGNFIVIQNICISKLAHGNAGDSENTKFLLLKQIGVMKVLFIIHCASVKIFFSCVIQSPYIGFHANFRMTACCTPCWKVDVKI